MSTSHEDETQSPGVDAVSGWGGAAEVPAARALDAWGDGLAVVDVHRRITDVNARMCEMAGLVREDLCGRAAPYPFWASPDDPEWTRGMRRLSDDGRCRFEAEVRRPDGNLTPVEVKGGVVRDVRRHPLWAVLGVTDISDVRARMQRLRDAGADYRSIAEHAPDAIVRFDHRLAHTYANRVTELISGFTRDRLLGRTHRELGLPEPIVEMWERQLTAARDEGRQGELEFEYDGPAGLRWYAVRVVPEVGPGGEVRSILGIGRDVTNAKSLEQRLEAERSAHRMLALRESALRRVAEVVARGEASQTVFDVAAEESARLLGADAGWVIAVDGGPPGRQMGGWRQASVAPDGLPLEVLMQGDGALARAARAAAPARVDDYAAIDGRGARAVVRAGFRAGAAAPVLTRGRMWGLLLVASGVPGMPDGAEEILARFADLVGTALANSEAARELDRLAHTDALTGLLNRRAFFERFAEEVHRARRHGDDLALVIVDVDHFKRVNDRFGHAAGDATLCEVAARLRSVVRRGEVLARIGGEEFAWLLPRVSLPLARAAAERARAAIGTAPIEEVGGLTMSAGIASLRDGDDLEGLMRRADAALYRAKNGGRDRVEVDDDG